MTAARPHNYDESRIKTLSSLEPIRRISLFDVDRNRQDMEKLRAELAEARDNLANLVAYAVRYLRHVQKKYGGLYPRRTRLAKFDAVAVRELTASELTICHDGEKGYLGHKVGGRPALACSSLDKLLLAWRDGRYRVVPPPEKLFVDKTLVHCAILDREKILLVVYREGGFTFIRKFAGGAVTNREYRCAPEGADVLLFADELPATIYVRYDVPPTAAIKQQEFDTTRLPLRTRDGKASLMSSKRIAFVGAARPNDWDDTLTGPSGVYMDF